MRFGGGFGSENTVADSLRASPWFQRRPITCFIARHTPRASASSGSRGAPRATPGALLPGWRCDGICRGRPVAGIEPYVRLRAPLARSHRSVTICNNFSRLRALTCQALTADNERRARHRASSERRARTTQAQEASWPSSRMRRRQSSPFDLVVSGPCVERCSADEPSRYSILPRTSLTECGTNYYSIRKLTSSGIAAALRVPVVPCAAGCAQALHARRRGRPGARRLTCRSSRDA